MEKYSWQKPHKDNKTGQQSLIDPIKLPKKARILKSMKFGNHNVALFLLLFFFYPIFLSAQEKINLKDLQPTFEEEQDVKEIPAENEVSLKYNQKKKTLKTNQTVVKLRALDKITARTSDIDIILEKKKDLVI